MVREGKMAKFIVCKEAEVRRPVSGKLQMPSKEVIPAWIRDGEKGAKEAAPARIRDGERGAKEAAPARIRDGERGAKEVVPARIQDGGEGANKVYSARIQDGEKGAVQVMPVSVQKVELEGRVLPGLPERHPSRADSGLTLAQLFSGN